MLGSQFCQFRGVALLAPGNDDELHRPLTSPVSQSLDDQVESLLLCQPGPHRDDRDLGAHLKARLEEAVASFLQIALDLLLFLLAFRVAEVIGPVRYGPPACGRMARPPILIDELPVLTLSDPRRIIGIVDPIPDPDQVHAVLGPYAVEPAAVPEPLPLAVQGDKARRIPTADLSCVSFTDGVHPIGENDPGLHKVGVPLVPHLPPVEQSLGETRIVEKLRAKPSSLVDDIAHVVNGECNLHLLKTRDAGELVLHGHRKQPRGPVVTVDDVGLPAILTEPLH